MRRKNKFRVLVAVMMLILGVGTAAFFAGKIYVTEKQDQESADAYDWIAEIAESEDKTEADEEAEPGEIPALPVSEESVTESEQENLIAESVPDVDLEAVQQVNTDIVCWLYSPDTVINYPVCHGSDNSYYLYHLADGTYNRNGCLFIDCADRGDFSDDNTIIYGHHMASGKMFASLINYADQSYYDLHPVMYLTIGDAQYGLEIFSGYTTTIDSSAYSLNFSTEQEFTEWQCEISSKSDFIPAAMTLTAEDHIVTLSTCAYSFQDARYVVHGRLVRL